MCIRDRFDTVLVPVILAIHGFPAVLGLLDGDGIHHAVIGTAVGSHGKGILGNIGNRVVGNLLLVLHSSVFKLSLIHIYLTRNFATLGPL